MARRTSERTRRIREVVESVPPEKVNEVSLIDLQTQLQKVGVSVETEREKYTVYSELTRRRRQLGKLKPSARRQKAVRLPSVPTDHEVGDSGQGDVKMKAAPSAEYVHDVGKLAAVYGRIKERILAEDWNIDVVSVMFWIGKLESEDVQAIRRFSEKYGCAMLSATAVAFLQTDK